MPFARFPELLREIAGEIAHPADSTLFKDIRIPIESIPDLARILEQSPGMAKECRSLVIEDMNETTLLEDESHDTDESDSGAAHESSIAEPDPEPIFTVRLAADLELILNAIGRHSQLKKFVWQWPGGPYQDEFVPPAVWRALSLSAEHLEELELSIFYDEHDTWVCFKHTIRIPEH